MFFEGASLAGICPIPPHLQTLLLGCGAVCQRLSRRAAIDVSTVVIGKVSLHIMPFGPGAGCVRSRHGRGDAGVVAGKDFEGAEIALVGKDVHTGLRSGGLDPEALETLYRENQFIHMSPSIDFEEQRRFRSGSQNGEAIDYLASNIFGKQR